MVELQSKKDIEKISHEILKGSKSFDVFPTPVDKIVSYAELTVNAGIDLSKIHPSYLSKATDVFRRAIAKVQGVLVWREKEIYLDLSIHESKQKFVKLHEVGHNVLTWQQKTYEVFGDDESTLDINTREEFEAEANFFASATLFQRLKNICRTNTLLADIREIVKDLPKEAKITGEAKAQIIARLEAETGFADWITISSWLCFSMNYALSFDELIKQTFYNSVRKTDYNADGYLHGVDIVHKDYQDLFGEYKELENVVFIVDPPYLSTDVKTYKEGDYWRLKDYLNVLKVLNNTNYIYFTSNKSSIVELMEWIEINLQLGNPFNNANKVTIKTRTTHSNGYEDIMLSKRHH